MSGKIVKLLDNGRPPSRLWRVSLAILVMYVTVSGAIQTDITNSDIGEATTINCSYGAEENPVNLYLFKNGALFFICHFSYSPSSCTRIEHPENNFGLTSLKIGAVSFRILRLGCVDQGLFVCRTKQLSAQTSVSIYKQSAVRLNMTECLISLENTSLAQPSDAATGNEMTNVSLNTSSSDRNVTYSINIDDLFRYGFAVCATVTAITILILLVVITVNKKRTGRCVLFGSQVVRVETRDEQTQEDIDLDPWWFESWSVDVDDPAAVKSDHMMVDDVMLPDTNGDQHGASSNERTEEEEVKDGMMVYFHTHCADSAV